MTKTRRRTKKASRKTNAKQPVKKATGDSSGSRPVKKTRGPGVKHRMTAVVEVSRCPRCQSTERTDYKRKDTVNISGIINGKPYSRIERRPTQCKSCGQHRIDLAYFFTGKKS